MTALDDRGELIANWWRDNPGQHTWAATLAGVKMQDSAKSRAARKRACEIAVVRGDCVQYATYANFNTWQYVKGSTKSRVGDAVTPLIDPMLHSAVTASGVKAKERTFHDHMVKERTRSGGFRGLTAEENELVQMQIDWEKNRRAQEELQARQMRLLMRMRNKDRQ